jgi:hypothetical protein
MPLLGWLRPRPRRPVVRRPARPAVELLEDRQVPTLLGNSVFPADNPWNQSISGAPVASNSATLINSVGATGTLHADFGSGTYAGANIGIPYNIVTGTQPKVTVVIDDYADESDLVPVPIPAGAVIEGDPLPGAQNDGDRHLLVYDKDNNIVYELFGASRPAENADGRWHAASEAVWNLNQNSFRPTGWTSADAAGLPILPGLIRADEVFVQGRIDHAIRFTVSASADGFVFPASHEAGAGAVGSLPRMGERFRLKASFDISGFSPANQVILRAMKEYGLIVADNGADWYLSGAPDARWDNDDLHELGSVPGSAFDVVDLTPRVAGLSATTGVPGGGTRVTITGVNFGGGAGQTKVYFGGVLGTNVTVNSDTSITVTAPAGTPGSTVDVRVASPYGMSAVVAADKFAYIANPFGTLEFNYPARYAREGNWAATLTVVRTGGSQGTVTVQYTTRDGSATAGADYVTTTGTLTFAPARRRRTCPSCCAVTARSSRRSI